MSLVQDEPKLSARTLLLVGVPSYIAAVIISTLTHDYVHVFMNQHVCGPGIHGGEALTAVFGTRDRYASCPLSSIAGPLWTFVLALTSFAFYLHFPRNLFAASMAFVNASARLPASIVVFLQLLTHSKTVITVDESSAISLLHFHDLTVATLILCFFSITILFLTVTIIHDTKIVPQKWLVAAILFLASGPTELLLWKILTPVLG